MFSYLKIIFFIIFKATRPREPRATTNKQNKQIPMKIRPLAFAVGALWLLTPASWAQVLTTYNNGDVFLGFRRDGAANTLAVNLGSATKFLTTAYGGTATPGSSFNVQFGVIPGTSSPVFSLNTDLTGVFTSSWTNNPVNGTGVRWAVVGLSGNTSSGIPGYTARTLFVTRERTAPGTPTSIPADRLDIGDFDTFSSAFNSFVQGTGGSAFKNQSSTTNSSVAYIGAANGADNWGTRINEASEGSFGLGSGYEVEQTFGAFSGPTVSVLDLWISPNEGSTTIPFNENTFLGSFTLNNAGQLSFTAVPEPSAYALLGLSAVGAFFWRLRQRRRFETSYDK